VTPVALFGFGHTEIIIIVVLLIVIFGAKRIPELGSSIGQGIRNFKKGMRQAQKEEEEDERLALEAEKTAPSLGADNDIIAEQTSRQRKDLPRDE